MLYVIPVPVEQETIIVPVATAHVGCKVAEAVGAAGVACWLRINSYTSWRRDTSCSIF
jgi:hypothetical protein